MKNFIFPLLLLFTLWGCSEKSISPNKNSADKAKKIELSRTALNEISSVGDTRYIEVTSVYEWQATSEADWCEAIHASNTTLRINITPNTNEDSRTTTVHITTSKAKMAITISQNGTSDGATVNEKIQLPLMFHVFYSNKSDRKQYIDYNYIQGMVAELNKSFSNSGIKLNIEFVLATYAPSDKKMDRPGVEYVEWDQIPMDVMDFMNQVTDKYTQYIWNYNEYINVMLFNFKADEKSKSITVGISSMPFTLKDRNSLPGLQELASENIRIVGMHCISLNTTKINPINDAEYAQCKSTFIHEMGHYLGLFHVFTEDPDKGMLDACYDTDYCDDTPSYNRIQYEKEEKNFFTQNRRKSCSGNTFNSTNIMDYWYGDLNKFTEDQKARMENVLNYSPFIPGRKKFRSVDTYDEPQIVRSRFIE